VSPSAEESPRSRNTWRLKSPAGRDAGDRSHQPALPGKRGFLHDATGITSPRARQHGVLGHHLHPVRGLSRHVRIPEPQALRRLRRPDPETRQQLLLQHGCDDRRLLEMIIDPANGRHPGDATAPKWSAYPAMSFHPRRQEVQRKKISLHATINGHRSGRGITSRPCAKVSSASAAGPLFEPGRAHHEQVRASSGRPPSRENQPTCASRADHASFMVEQDHVLLDATLGMNNIGTKP